MPDQNIPQKPGMPGMQNPQGNQGIPPPSTNLQSQMQGKPQVQQIQQTAPTPQNINTTHPAQKIQNVQNPGIPVQSRVQPQNTPTAPPNQNQNSQIHIEENPRIAPAELPSFDALDIGKAQNQIIKKQNTQIKTENNLENLKKNVTKKAPEKKKSHYHFFLDLGIIAPLVLCPLAFWYLPKNITAYALEGTFFGVWALWSIIRRGSFFGGMILSAIISTFVFLFLHRESEVLDISANFYKDVNFWAGIFHWGTEHILPLMGNPMIMGAMGGFFLVWIVGHFLLKKIHFVSGFGMAMFLLLSASAGFIHMNGNTDQTLKFAQEKFGDFQKILNGEKIENKEIVQENTSEEENMKAAAPEFGLPDLRIIRISPEITFLPEGRKITYSIQVRNIGDAPMETGFTVKTQNWKGKVLVEETEVSSDEVLQVGFHTMVEIVGILPELESDVSFVAVVDPENITEEIDEENNMSMPHVLHVKATEVEEKFSECPIAYTPVCGKVTSDKCDAGQDCTIEKTFRNACDLAAEKNATKLHEGVCSADAAQCQEGYIPVCGENAEGEEESFENECEMKKAGAKKIYEGECTRKIKDTKNTKNISQKKNPQKSESENMDSANNDEPLIDEEIMKILNDVLTKEEKEMIRELEEIDWGESEDVGKVNSFLGM